MLEQPIESSVPLAEKSDELVNQQETKDLAWFAGILEADGWITVNTYKCSGARRGNSIKVVVGVCGQDAIVIREVYLIWRRMGIVGCIGEGSTPKGNKKILALTTSKFSNIKVILRKVIPYMRGEKRARAELALQFILSRLSRQNLDLDEKEVYILNRYCEGYSGKYKGERSTNLSRFLTDLTLPPPKAG
jgi:hypothetical protein